MVTAAVVDEIRYPVGEFRIDPDATPQKRTMWIEQMAEAPAKLGTALVGLSKRRVDAEASCASPGRCPAKRLHALQTRLDRGQACHQDL